MYLFFLATGEAPSFLGLPGPRFAGPPIDAANPPRGSGMSALRDSATSGVGNPICEVVVVVPAVDAGPEDEDRDISLEDPGIKDDDDDDCGC